MEAVADPGFRGTHGYVQDLGDLAIGVPLVVRQLDSRPLQGRQTRHGQADLARRRAAFVVLGDYDGDVLLGPSHLAGRHPLQARACSLLVTNNVHRASMRDRQHPAPHAAP